MDDREADSSTQRSNELLDKQISQNEADIETKRRSMYDTRLSIIKSSGKENWASSNPNVAKSTSDSGAL